MRIRMYDRTILFSLKDALWLQIEIIKDYYSFAYCSVVYLASLVFTSER